MEQDVQERSPLELITNTVELGLPMELKWQVSTLKIFIFG